MVELPGTNRREGASQLDARSRVALIIGHVEQLADQASTSEAFAAGASPKQITPGGVVRRVIHARAARRRFFDGDLFADPAWDILLELFALRCEQRRTSVSKLCIAAGVPATTALRWIDKLHVDGLVEREADPFDARRIWVALSDRAFESMHDYLHEIRGAAPF